MTTIEELKKQFRERRDAVAEDVRDRMTVLMKHRSAHEDDYLRGCEVLHDKAVFYRARLMRWYASEADRLGDGTWKKSLDTLRSEYKDSDHRLMQMLAKSPRDGLMDYDIVDLIRDESNMSEIIDQSNLLDVALGKSPLQEDPSN